MSRNTLLARSTAALALLAAAAPAMAQVADPELVIEGKINEITANTITVMGIKINVPTGLASTPTKKKVPLGSLNDPLPGRPAGFVGGTAIVVGGSVNGVVTASDVFSDVNENVIVGEATADFTAGATGLTVNFKEADPIPADTAIPAAPPMNIFGFVIDPKTIDKGSLVSIEGYEAADGGKIYYHGLEADTGTPVNSASNEVGITRAQCRDRAGAGKDELEIRGAVHLAGMVALTTTNRGTVTLTYKASPTSTGSLTATPILDPANPRYAEYRASSSNRTLDSCPVQLTASWKGDTDVEIAQVDAAAEAR
jgi:hypothetical protein